VQFSGADIGSISNPTPYLDASKKEFQFTNHEVRYILVDKVKTRGGNLMITARIDIYPSANACHESQYKKTFLVGNIDVTSPQQAVMGRIYNIGDDFGHVVDRQLAKESRSFVSVGTTNYDIDKRRPDIIKMIAQDTGAQYI
ncbi:flagellar assembly protein T N-terminal domain-containing protein, partial [Vibrio sp. 10N.222.49.E5]|uniref:flagellar assembly protein T N-terminal domain-containing protein n=1 Tax=Vibrio sp. 10N.222.49.E5 TaxID=3229617 RepID=UPI00354F3B2E